MRILLDTCVVLWWMADSSDLTQRERALIADESNEIFVSTASAWEIEIKRKQGKLALPDDWKTAVVASDFSWLNVTPRHTDFLRNLPDIHRDPFDRMLVAQSKAENLTVLTHDAKVAAYFE